MYIEFNTEYVARYLCKMANMESATNEMEKALYDLKAMAQNKYNSDYWRTLVKVLDEITNYDFFED